MIEKYNKCKFKKPKLCWFCGSNHLVRINKFSARCQECGLLL